MTTVYIAGPMSGYPDYNRLEAAGWSVITPVHDDDLDVNGDAVQPWAWYLKRDLRLRVLAAGQERHAVGVEQEGAQLELYVASQLDMDIRILEGWL